MNVHQGILGKQGTIFAMVDIKEEIAHQAARYVVEEGLGYGPAKQRAVRDLGLGRRSALPDNDQLELAVAEYLALFCGDTQPAELCALRSLALTWMDRLELFRPHLSGAVWRGTATRLTDIYLDLFCDDSKMAEITLIDQGLTYTVTSLRGLHGMPVDTLSLHTYCAPLNEDIGVHLALYQHDDVRGALRPDTRGRAPRGDARAVRRLLDEENRS